MSNGTTEVRAPRSRGTNVALIISLCVNLLLVGIVGAAVVRVHYFGPPPFGPDMMDGHRHGHGGPGHGRMMWQLQQALTPQGLQHAAPAKAAKIQAIMDAHRARLSGLGADSVNARRDALGVFAAQNFDKAAFDAALSRVQLSDAAFKKEILAVLSESAGTLSPEERKAVADQRMRDGGGFFWRHGFHHGFEERPPPPPPPGSPPAGEH